MPKRKTPKPGRTLANLLNSSIEKEQYLDEHEYTILEKHLQYLVEFKNDLIKETEQLNRRIDQLLEIIQSQTTIIANLQKNQKQL